MSKLIIDNQSGMPDDMALQYVMTVIRLGRASEEGRNHCPITTFIDGVIVLALRNKASDRFVVRGKV